MSWDDWLGRIGDGQKPSVESFARSALGDLPVLETPVSRLTNWRAWGFDSKAEMDAAFYPEKEPKG